MLTAGRLRVWATPKRCIVASMVSPFMGAPLSECTVSWPGLIPWRAQMSRSNWLASSALSQSNTCQPTILRLNKLKQVQIEVLAAHLSGQIGDVPTENLIGPGGYQGPSSRFKVNAWAHGIDDTPEVSVQGAPGFPK